VLDANPGYRDERWDFAASADGSAADARIVRQMQGKKFPDRAHRHQRAAGRPVALAVLHQRRDRSVLAGRPLAPKALLDGKLRPELAAQGIQLRASSIPC
jgi:hypothetical protein